MRTKLFAACVVVAGIASGISGAGAYSGGYTHSYTHQVQYGGGHNSYGGGYNQRHHEGPRCHWERQRVKVWSERYGRWTWVWKRVRICD